MCARTGLELAEVPTKDESVAIASAIAALSPTAGAHSFWIGLDRGSGGWSWSSGPFSPSAGLDWAPGEPNNSGGYEACGEYLIGSNTLNDLACASALPYVCQPDPEASTPFQCAHPLRTRFGEYCLHPDHATSYWGAKDACVAGGGKLADLGSLGTARALAAATGTPIATGSVWIGANDDVNEGHFVWMNGEPVGASAWAAGEPNNSGGENCTELILSTGLWNDLRCDTLRAPLCAARS